MHSCCTNALHKLPGLMLFQAAFLFLSGCWKKSMHFKKGFAESADPVQGNGHCPHRADCDAEAAAAALFSIKYNSHFRTFESKSSCGADPGTGAALETALIIAVN